MLFDMCYSSLNERTYITSQGKNIQLWMSVYIYIEWGGLKMVVLNS